MAESDPLAKRMALAQRLAEGRENKKLTQEQVAQHFEINKATVSAWENGRGVPDSLRLAELATLYGVTPDSLLGAYGLSTAALTLAADFERRSPPEKSKLLKLWKVLTEASEGVGDAEPKGTRPFPANGGRKPRKAA